VIALFDAVSLFVDGQPYTYAWFVKLKDGKLVEVAAFLDTSLPPRTILKTPRSLTPGTSATVARYGRERLARLHGCGHLQRGGIYHRR